MNRLGFIGASDAAAVLGLSRWKTPLEIWAEKTAIVEPEDVSEKLAVKLGNRLEEVVAELFTEATGKKVHRVVEAYVHKRHPFLTCQIDRKVVGERSILQCKTASSWKAKEWVGEEIPREYIIQELHELACTGYDRAYIAVLIGNEDFKWKVVERDEALIADVVSREVHFWNTYIIPKVMPAIITKDDAQILYQLFPVADQSKVIELDDKANIFVESLESLKADRNNLDGIIAQQENELKALLKDAEVGETERYVITWKTQVKKAHEVKESVCRVLRHKKKQEAA